METSKILGSNCKSLTFKSSCILRKWWWGFTKIIARKHGFREETGIWSMKKCVKPRNQLESTEEVRWICKWIDSVTACGVQVNYSLARNDIFREGGGLSCQYWTHSLHVRFRSAVSDEFCSTLEPIWLILGSIWAVWVGPVSCDPLRMRKQ
jgi:hypothetical protein